MLTNCSTLTLARSHVGLRPDAVPAALGRRLVVEAPVLRLEASVGATGVLDPGVVVLLPAPDVGAHLGLRGRVLRASRLGLCDFGLKKLFSA